MISSLRFKYFPVLGFVSHTGLSIMATPTIRRSARRSASAARGPSVAMTQQVPPKLVHSGTRSDPDGLVYTWPAPLIQCKLVKRYKRFLADMQLPDMPEIVTAHCPNPGSMRGLQVDQTPDALVSKAPSGSTRKLDYTLEAILVDGKTLVGCNTSLPNTIVHEWLRDSKEAKEFFGNFTSIRREVVYGKDSRSRIDFLLDYADGKDSYYVEVKNVTMAWDDGDTRVAVFPDSKTVRGQKHLQELRDVVQMKGSRACVLYFVNRSDCCAFAPCTIDPKYVELFMETKKAGVGVFPLVFELQFDPLFSVSGYVYRGQLPEHARSGP